VVGTTGPLVVDMGVYYHNFYTDITDGERKTLDFITICPAGEEITVEALAEALREYNSRIGVQKQLTSGRTYFFEGLKQDREGNWAIWWG
jgi:hypothetical protein